MKQEPLILGLVVLCTAWSRGFAEQIGQSPTSAIARRYYDEHLSRCGDSYIAQWTYLDGSGSQLLELKDVTFHVQPLAISPADRLNGLEAAAKAWMKATVLRRTREVTSAIWDPWIDGGNIFWLSLVKKKGLEWQIEPIKGGTTYASNWYSGYLQQYPCDNVPGHPVRLAREKAEHEAVRRAVEARAAEEETRRAAERKRVEGAIAGEWQTAREAMARFGSGRYPSRLTITREGNGFSGIKIEPAGHPAWSDVRKILSIEILSTNQIRLVTLKMEKVSQTKPAEASSSPETLTLSADRRSLITKAGEVQYSRNGPIASQSVDTISAAPGNPPITLTLRANGNGNGTITFAPTGLNCSITNSNRSCSATFPTGTFVTLTVTPATGHKFVAWSSSSPCTGTGPCQVALNRELALGVLLVSQP